MVDNNDDPLVTVMDDDADLRKAIVDLLSVGIEARAFNSAPIATPRVALSLVYLAEYRDLCSSAYNSITRLARRFAIPL